MTTESRFSREVVERIAKRAANRCSNPDCGAITSGPSSEPSDVINIGQAAHIYGANPGSARFEPNMAPSDRSALANAIWLCSNCHKQVDDDPTRFPAGLLFEWQRGHEHRIAEMLGRPGAEARKRYEDRHLEEFGRLSYLAERIILEKESFWEYRLTAEVLRFEMSSVLQRWRALQLGLYIKPRSRIATDECFHWIGTKSAEALNIAAAFGGLINNEFQRAWGDPGVPGSDKEIVSTCRLYREMCEAALQWEESLRFVDVDEVFSELLSLHIGVIGVVLNEASKLPEFIARTMAGNPEPGTYELRLTLNLPDGWADSVEAAGKRVVRKLGY